jgi:hypothetical protein
MCAAWRAATGDSKVQIQYNNYAAHGGPQRVVYKQHYSVPIGADGGHALGPTVAGHAGTPMRRYDWAGRPP